jgi:hypothetical protein
MKISRAGLKHAARGKGERKLEMAAIKNRRRKRLIR